MNTNRLSYIRVHGLLETISIVTGVILNSAIDLLPIELNVPGYQYCGPGTNVPDSALVKIDQLPTICLLRNLGN